MGFFMSTFYLPVFHDLNITSTYEASAKNKCKKKNVDLKAFIQCPLYLQYLEARFDRRLRMFGAIMFTIMNVSSNTGHFPSVVDILNLV